MGYYIEIIKSRQVIVIDYLALVDYNNFIKSSRNSRMKAATAFPLKPKTLSFFAMLRVNAEAAVMKLGADLGAPQDIESCLKAVATNARWSEEVSGYRLLPSCEVDHRGGQIYLLTVNAAVFNRDALEEAAFDAYEKAWKGEAMSDAYASCYDDHGLLFEVVLGSNASRTQECGFEIVNWDTNLSSLYHT